MKNEKMKLQTGCFYQTRFFKCCLAIMTVSFSALKVSQLNFVLDSQIPRAVQLLMIPLLTALLIWIFRRAIRNGGALSWLSVLMSAAFSYGLGVYFAQGRHVLLLLLFCVFVPVLHHALGRESGARVRRAACVVGAILAQFFFFGAQVSLDSTVPYIQLFHIREQVFSNVCRYILQDTALICCFSALIADMYEYAVKKEPVTAAPAVQSGAPGKRILCMTLVLVFLWLPIFVIFYPGMMSIDSAIEVRQQLGTLPASNHHPMAHQMMIRLGLYIGKLFGSYTAGVGIYSVMQMFLLAAAFSVSIEELGQLGLGRPGRILLLCVYGLYVPNAMHSITMWKDVPFAAFALFLTTALVRELREAPEKWLPPARMLLFILASLGFCLFRSNGLHAFILGMPFFLLLAERPRRKWLAACAAALVLVFGAQVAINASGAEKVRTAEMLSTPLEQIARVVAYSGEEERESEEFAVLREVLPALDELDREYDFRLADMLKDSETFQSEVFDTNPLRYAGAWLRIGLRHPRTYVEAFLLQGCGYWFPDFDSELFYPGIVWTEAEIQMNTQFQSTRLNLLTVFQNLTRECSASVLFSAGIMIWALLLAMGLLFAKGRYPFAAAAFPLLGIWVTTLASPVYNEYRYVYGVTVCIPLFLLLSLLLSSRERNAAGQAPQAE